MLLIFNSFALEVSENKLYAIVLLMWLTLINLEPSSKSRLMKFELMIIVEIDEEGNINY